jgi:hypothetical protein
MFPGWRFTGTATRGGFRTGGGTVTARAFVGRSGGWPAALTAAGPGFAAACPPTAEGATGAGRCVGCFAGVNQDGTFDYCRGFSLAADVHCRRVFDRAIASRDLVRPGFSPEDAAKAIDRALSTLRRERDSSAPERPGAEAS